MCRVNVLVYLTLLRANALLYQFIQGRDTDYKNDNKKVGFNLDSYTYLSDVMKPLSNQMGAGKRRPLNIVLGSVTSKLRVSFFKVG